MRLTLRTMLAYLDDILEPTDAQELSHKIEESKFASELVHRIRNSTSRPRLAAPRVDGKGMAADPNTVAEYLDNVMPPDHVPEFEKVCLESDVHLAEVASAHQILTLVLGEPAVFDGNIRERMYAIGYLGTGSASVKSSGATASPTGKSQGGAGSTTDNGAERTEDSPALHTGDAEMTEPAHLVDRRTTSRSGSPRRRSDGVVVSPAPAFPWKSMAVTLLLGFIVAFVALRAMGEFGPRHPLVRLLMGDRQTADATNTDREPSAKDTSDSGLPTQPVFPATSQSPQPPANSEFSSAPGRPVAIGSTERSGTEGNSASNIGVAPQPPVVGLPKVGETAGGPAASSPNPATTTKSEIGIAPPVPSTAIATEQPAINPATGDKTIATTPANPAAVPVGSTAPAVSAKVPIDPFDGTPVSPRPDKPPTPTPPSPAGDLAATPINTGLYLSEEQILARLDKADGTWLVLPVNSPLVAGDELLSLPTYRPQIMVTPNIKVTLSGETTLKMHVPDATNLPRVTLQSGRATFVPVGEMGGAIKIDVGGRAGLLSFADAESSAAIDVRLYLPPGANALAEPPRIVVQLWSVGGAIEWQEMDRAAIKIAAGHGAWFMDDGPASMLVAPAVPTWIDGKNLIDIDRRASQELKKFLTVGRPLTLSLMEQTSARQVEVRSLARRALCSLDVFEPALESLENDDYRSYWQSQLDALQSSLGQGTEVATRLRAAIDKLYGAQAATVFRMIAGYSPEELAAGGSTELVDGLANPSMTIRVLAYENLRRITGGKTLLFRPEARLEQEKSRVNKWRKMAEEGQITYATPPSPLSLPPGSGEAGKPPSAK